MGPLCVQNNFWIGLMSKIYENNGQRYLVYRVDTHEDLETAYKFAGDRFKTYETSGQVLMLTLKGWQVVTIGDRIIHIPASEWDPITFKQGELKEEFKHPGFLVFGPENFQKFFTEVM